MNKQKRFTTPDKIELRSEEVQEILGRPPKWIIRYGITLIFVIVAGLFIGSYFFKYPDILEANIIVTTENVPAGIVAKTSGRIDSLFVCEKQCVKQGEIVATIENPARLEDVLKVKNFLRNFILGDSLFYSLPEKELQLGDIQQSYIHFIKAYGDYQYFAQANYHDKMIKVLQEQLKTQQQMLKKSKRQAEIVKQQLVSAKYRFDVDSALVEKKALSRTGFESSKITYLQQVQGYESAEMNIDNLHLSILQLQQNIFELEQQKNEEISSHQLSISGACEQLNAQIKQWEQSYLLVSPVSGTATLTKYWQQNQNISAGEVLVTIIPEGKSRMVGKIILPLQGAGKVKEGQFVNVKFQNFPYMEFGMVRVPISQISLVPVTVEEDIGYVLEVNFPEKLITNYGKELAFSQEMQGTAEIITDDLRLLDRFINPIRALWKR